MSKVNKAFVATAFTIAMAIGIPVLANACVMCTTVLTCSGNGVCTERTICVTEGGRPVPCNLM
jgi:hypothetical protein